MDENPVPLTDLTEAEYGVLIGLALHEGLDPTDYVAHRDDDGWVYTVGLDDSEHRLTPTTPPKPLGMPYWEAVPGGRKCPSCGEVIPVRGTKLNQAVHDHWATHDTDKEG